jgi:hypothetical protein
MLSTGLIDHKAIVTTRGPTSDWRASAIAQFDSGAYGSAAPPAG